MLPFLLALLCAQAPERPRAVALVIPPRAAVRITPGPVQADRDGVVLYLYAGDRVTVKEGQAVLLFFADNHRERLRPGEVTVGPRGCEPAGRVERLKPPQERAVQVGLQELGPDGRIGAAVFRDDPGKPVAPFSGTTVLTDRPAFTWRPAAKVIAYQFRLLKAGSNALVWKAETKESRLAYPDKERPLQRGRQYVWKVTATTREKDYEGFADVVSSEFLVATAKEADELTKVRPLAASADLGDVFLAAVAYQAKGCLAEALAAYERLAEKAPQEPGYHRALAYLYERAGQADKAQAEREKGERGGGP